MQQKIILKSAWYQNPANQAGLIIGFAAAIGAAWNYLSPTSPAQILTPIILTSPTARFCGEIPLRFDNKGIAFPDTLQRSFCISGTNNLGQNVTCHTPYTSADPFKQLQDMSVTAQTRAGKKENAIALPHNARCDPS